MAAAPIAAALVAANLLVTASAFYDPACSAKPLNTFDLKKMLGCGFNADAWSLWIPPSGYAYCQRDSIDISDKGDYTCYTANSTGHCRMVPYIYVAVDGEEYMERDLGRGIKSRAIILDTDNCKFLVQIECFPDGKVWRYLTYKNTWTPSEASTFKAKVKNEKALSFLRAYSFGCHVGKP